MKVTIERNSLLKTLGHVQSVVERRNTIPILSNVMVEAEGDMVSMTATDLDIAIIERVSASVQQPGSTTIPAHTLFDIVRKLPDGSEVELTLEEGERLVVKAGRSRFTLACLDKEDFPVMNDGDMPHRFDLAAEELKRLIDKARFAISTEETRYYLNGITCMLPTVKTDSACVRSPQTATAWRKSSRMCRMGLPACLASSFRARRLVRFVN